MVFVRDGDFYPKTTVIVLWNCQVFVLAELDVGEVAHVEYVFDFLSLGLVGAEQEGFVVADGQQMKEGIEV